MTAAEIIAARLRAAGCRFAFGIPGGEVLALIDALSRQGLRFVLTKHENSAGFMAEGVHHMTGAPGVLVATIGPGVANAVNVVANAQQDRVPLVFLTGCVDPSLAQTYTHQVFDHQAVLRPLVKASFAAVDGAVDVIIDKALSIAQDGQPGPVHIDLPIGLAGREQPDPVAPPLPPAAPAAPAPGPGLERARSWLAEAERPLMIAGLDVVNQGAGAEVAALARDHGIPLLTSYKAKGVLSEDDPLSLGGAGLSPRADALVKPLLAQSDLILLAGYDPIEMRAGWRDPFPSTARVLEFAAVANTHFMHRASISFVGDVGAGLRLLRDGVRPRPTWPGGEPEAARASLRQAFSAGAAWGPAAIFATARRVLPPATVATADSGAHRILLSQMWRCPAPRTLLQSTGLCTMGCALPLAMGVRLADPARPVAVFVGDAGLEMVLGELATLRDWRVPLIILVLVDRSLALIEQKQRAMQLPNQGVDFGSTDFAAVARALGGHGAWIDGVAALEDALHVALSHDTFTVLACSIDRRAYDGTF